MKQKLIQALKEQGLSEELAGVIHISTEEEIEGIISKLKPTPAPLDIPTFLASNELQNYITEYGLDKVFEHSKLLQSEYDKKVHAGIKSMNHKEASTSPKDTKTSTEKTEPQWAKDLRERIKLLESEKQQSTKIKTAQELLARSILPKSLQQRWLNRIDLRDQERIEEQIIDFEKEFEEMNNQFLNSRNGLPTGGMSDGKISDKEAQEIADELI